MRIKLFSQVVQLSNEIVDHILSHSSTRSHSGSWHILHLQNKVIHLKFELSDVLFSLVDAPYQKRELILLNKAVHEFLQLFDRVLVIRDIFLVFINIFHCIFEVMLEF